MPLLDGHDPKAVRIAAAAIVSGELVAFPTETVYGLGARADDDAAVARIFAAKGRPADHPLIVHVPDAAAAARFTPALDGAARVLVEAFWPGPLTVIVPRSASVAAGAAGGQPNIGLRCPSHPVARALLQATQRLGVAGVAAPSANRFGHLSPTCAAHVVAEFGPALRVLDGGPCALGIESTIVDCTRAHPVLLRPGTLPCAAIEQVLNQPLLERDALAPRAPGTLASHYAPRANLRLMDAAALGAALAALGPPGSGPSLAVYSISACSHRKGLLQRRMPGDAAAAAYELFAVLRGFDDAGVQQIWVETPPAGDEWAGVRDRLQRAAA